MLSENYKHLYFPINWDKANSRAVAYLINMKHDLILDKLHQYDFKGQLVEFTHTRLSGNTFKVSAKVMPKKQWVLFLLLFKNPYRLNILKQLQEGKNLEDVVMP